MAGEDYADHLYFRVPNELWTRGWITALTGPALAMLLVLLQQSAGANRSEQELWFSPAVADRRFHLSEETRKRGLDGLHKLGLVTINRRPITSNNPLEATRLRNTYTLHTARLVTEEPQLVR